MTVFISTIIPTIGRETLSRAVQSVLDQRFRDADFEVIVVNDSGIALPAMSWSDAPNLQIINTNHRERSAARNAGAAVARGKYLHFLDDDDWILPDAFDRFWELVQQTTAGMYYGGYRFVDSNGNTLEECRPDESGNCFIRFMSGEWQPLQASLFDARIFHSVGGFAPLEMLRGGDEDVDLTRRISLQNDIAGFREPVAVIRFGHEESTTNYTNLQEQSRQSREMILSLPGVFSRLRESAKGRLASDYWHGRMIWIYLSSVAWNIRQGNIFTSFSRWAYFGFGILLSFRYWFSPKFWRGATRPHQANGWLVSGETNFLRAGI
jgi:glycosyltransferase involved in cell wall biosynthesis